jgi:hypothetical protein
MHHIKAFTQLHIKKIPNAYILKRYTRGARSFIEWDPNDMPKDGQDKNRADMRFAKLVGNGYHKGRHQVRLCV